MVHGDLNFTCLGNPVPQGSMRWLGARGMVAANRTELEPWRESLRAAAHAAMGEGWKPLDGPLHVLATFVLRPPKSKPSWRRWPDSRPDLDKLVRALFDACTSVGAWCDDAQVVILSASKCYVGERDDFATPGVHVHIWDITT
jgi:crossover junction endodeoxyribonuclease RusA